TGRSGVHSLTLRGFDQRQTTLLIDGVPAYVPYDGLLNLDLLPVEILDHITLVKRSGSQLHSPNSMGGTINLVTRAPGAGPLVELLTDYGSANALNLGASHALRLGPVSYTLYGGWRRRDAFPLAASFTPTPRENGVLRENSDSAIFHAGGTFRVRISDRHVLRASALLVDGARGIPPGLDEPVVRYWRFSTWRALNVSAGHRGRYLGGSLEVDEVAFFRGFDNLVDSFDDDTYQTQTSARAFHSGHHDQLAGGRARAHLHLAKTPWGPTDLRLWLSGQVDRHEEDAPPPGNNTLMRGLVSIIPEAEAFFGERWSATTAAQLDIEIPGTTPGGNAASRLGFGFWVSGHFDPSDNLSLRGTVARRHRFPTLKERFTSAQGRRIPNPDLTPEKAWRFSLDATWCPLRAISFRGGLHDAEVSDLIVLTPQGGGREQLRNISSARLLGADVEVSYRWRRWIDAHAAYAFLYARQDRVLTGDDRLPYRPAHQATFVFRSTPLTWLAL
ncbi:MAG: TonB-dependent receptor, partial [Deltaproteobacteria bacterium]|nr:TonB-dependent receptor [Deltaproteobacteria bacterium]